MEVNWIPQISFSTDLVACFVGGQHKDCMAKVLWPKIGEYCWKIKTSTKIFLDPPGTTIDCPSEYAKRDVLESFLGIRCSCQGGKGLFGVCFSDLIDESWQ